MEKIHVESEPISTQLEAFKGEMDKLEKLFTKFDGELSDAKSIWEGEASDTTLTEIEKLKKLFDFIRNQNGKYTEFLNSVIEKYSEEDSNESEILNSNEKAFIADINGKV